MFSYTPADICSILLTYGILSSSLKIEELQKYDNDGKNGRLRVIIKVVTEETSNRFSQFVVRIKDERDVSETVFESQCRFSEILAENGIPTARILPVVGEKRFVQRRQIDGRTVFVAAETFMENEIRLVDIEITQKMGTLLARSHTVSERTGCHVPNRVIFDPFEENDLFYASNYIALGDRLTGENLILHQKTVKEFWRIMKELEPLRMRARYAVQGDLSDCNCFYTPSGEVGFFDFNNAGDSVLFCDAVMQGLFVARLMDYPENRSFSDEDLVRAFFRGYCSERPFDAEDVGFYSHLRAVIEAFWADSIGWSNDNGWDSCKPASLYFLVEKGDMEAINRKLKDIYSKLTDKYQFVLENESSH